MTVEVARVVLDIYWFLTSLAPYLSRKGRYSGSSLENVRTSGFGTGFRSSKVVIVREFLLWVTSLGFYDAGSGIDANL
jgi:hypothetical protein